MPPSVQLQTVTAAVPFSHARSIATAGARLWAAFYDGTNYVYQYSDDSGATWSSEVTVRAADVRGSLFYDSTNTRINFATAGANSSSTSLQLHSISSNVTSGTPGSITTTTIDAGGANAGVQWPYALVSPTATNPRYWVIAKKTTAASTFETRVWYCAAGAAADTAGNWSTTNFTNLGGNSDANTNKLGTGAYWTVAGASRVTFVIALASPNSFEAVTFDPSATTPTPGTVTAVPSSVVTDSISPDTDGGTFAVSAKADYLVFGRMRSATSSLWDFWKTVNGTTWTNPTGWQGLTMGRAQIATDLTDFHLLHSETYGAAATTAQTIVRRQITVVGDVMGGAPGIGPGTTSGRFFADSSPWNTRIVNPVVRSQSATWVTALLNNQYVNGLRFNTSVFTPPINIAPAGTTRVSVAVPNGWVMESVPVPANMVASPDPVQNADNQAIIWDQDLDRFYDFFRWVKSGTSYSCSATVLFRAHNGSGFWDANFNPGDGFAGPWGAHASSAALAGGLIRKEEVEAGYIPHALALGTPHAVNGPAISPVTSSDGQGGASAMPMGSHLMLDQSVNIATLGLDPSLLMVARALQEYGAFTVESASNFIAYCQNTVNVGNYIPAGWANGIPESVLATHLRIIDPPPVPTYDNRSTADWGNMPHR